MLNNHTIYLTAVFHLTMAKIIKSGTSHISALHSNRNSGPKSSRKLRTTYILIQCIGKYKYKVKTWCFTCGPGLQPVGNKSWIFVLITAVRLWKDLAICTKEELLVKTMELAEMAKLTYIYC